MPSLITILTVVMLHKMVVLLRVRHTHLVSWILVYPLLSALLLIVTELSYAGLAEGADVNLLLMWIHNSSNRH